MRSIIVEGKQRTVFTTLNDTMARTELSSVVWWIAWATWKGKEMFYLTTTHFIYGYMALDIW